MFLGSLCCTWIETNGNETCLVMLSFIFITCQRSFTGGLWSATLLINILFVTWTAPLYGVPYNIGPGCSAFFRPHRTVGLMLTVLWGMKLLINLWPIPKNISLKGKAGEKKNQVWPQKYKGYACGPKLYGCMFPGSPCHTQTETNGNIHRHMCLGYLDPITILNV